MVPYLLLARRLCGSVPQPRRFLHRAAPKLAPLLIATLGLSAFAIGPAAARSPEAAQAAAALKCQRAVSAAAARFASARDGDAAKCVGGLVKCLLARAGEGGCAFRASGTCSKTYEKQAALAATLRASIRRKCDAETLLAASAVGFEQLADLCSEGDKGGNGASAVLDPIDTAIACVADEHVCSGGRGLVATAPRTSELLRDAGALSSLPVGTSCLPDFLPAGASPDEIAKGRQAAPCVSAMLKAGQRDRDGWRKAYGKCLGDLFACGQLGTKVAECQIRAAATCDAAFAKAPPVDPDTVAVDDACAEEVVPFATLATAAGANVSALAAACREVGIAALTNAGDWRACIARTAACEVAGNHEFVYPRSGELLGVVERSMLPAFCPGYVPAPTRTPTPTPTATVTASATVTPIPTVTATPVATGTVTPVATVTALPSPTFTPGGDSPTSTPTRTVTPLKTATPVPAQTSTPNTASTTSATPVPTSTAGGGCDGDPAPYGFVPAPTGSTCHFDGSPDPAPAVQVERAFPNLGFTSPVQLTHAPDGSNRLFVVEQGGTIRVFSNVESAASSTVFLDVSGVPSFVNGGEQGLLGLAFHPEYAANGTFYVYYSTASPHRTVIARYHVSANPNVADPASGQVLLQIDQPPFDNHKGGQLVFGPDGMLYASIGDGGSAGDPNDNAQSLDTLLGKILRIDIDHADPGLMYAVPPDNPFVGVPGARGEIWALGMRNPWRMSFDTVSRTLWAGDVGQETYEEIDVIERGNNYGWRRKEGNTCYNPASGCDDGTLTAPVVAHPHQDGSCSVVGGFVYHGSKLPELYDAYVYGDYCSGKLWALRLDGTIATVQTLGSSSFNISSFGEDDDGELYILNHGVGTIHRLNRLTGSVPGTFPRTLSATGCFDDLATRHPASGLLPYDVQSPLWSDGASKRRFVVLPAGATIGHQTSGSWSFPEGTILVKEFSLELERGNPASTHALETRFLIRHPNGWEGYTYQWNEAQTDAFLLEGATTGTYDVTDPQQPGVVTAHTHYFPSRGDCTRCHTSPAGGALGLQTGQLNRTHDYDGVSDNQLRAWEHAGLFGACLPARPASLPRFADPADVGVSLDARARSYLHANCAQCHRPGGTAPTAIDLRAEASFFATHLCNTLPQAGDLGISGAKLLSPGHAEDSILWLRATMRGTSQMPPLATLIPDSTGSDLLADWITSIASCPAN